ncbi:MAG: MarR family transcriptional regulator [Chloroflexi bacterium]|nr:MarR family transcriptional regulator [Chloroflexota bacterium]
MDEQTVYAVYAFIRVYIREWGYAPSIREIARACYISPGNVYRYLDKLEGKGLIERQPGVARSIRLLVDEQA